MTPDALGKLQQAAQLFSRRRLAEAERACRALLEKYPDAVDVIHLLALVRRQRGDSVEAERLLQDCLARAPQRADIHANLGNLLVATGRNAEAIAAYRAALERDAGFRPARLGLARTLQKTGEHEAAKEAATALTAGNDADAEAWNIAGAASRSLGQHDDAEFAFRRALVHKPGYGVAWHNLGALLAAMSRSEEALEALQRARTSGVSGPEIEFNVASVLMALLRLDEAETLLKKQVQLTPQDLPSQRLLARLRYMRGRDDFAATLESTVRRFPADVALRALCTQVLRGAGRLDEAGELLAEVARHGDASLLAELAALHQEAGRFQAAHDAARRALEARPGHAGFQDLLIDALMSLGRADDAMPLIEAARRRQPLNQWYVAMEATAARLLGDARYSTLYDYDALVQTFELSSPAGFTDIDAFHHELVPALQARHQFVAPPLDQSLRFGTQTPRGLLGDPDPLIRAFLGLLEAPLGQYCERLGRDPAHPLRSRNTGATVLQGCWSVRLRRGGHHVNHVHSEGWISSAYYVKVPDEVRDTAARSGWIKFGEPRFPVPGADPERYVQPAAGRLVLFPSYMWHGTTPILGDQERLTVAFDAVPAKPA